MLTWSNLMVAVFYPDIHILKGEDHFPSQVTAHVQGPVIEISALIG